MNSDLISCPVTGKLIQDITGTPSMNYKGETYYFCCKGCLKKFKAQPDYYLSGNHTGGCCHSHC